MVNTMQHKQWFSAVILLLYVKDGLFLDDRHCSKSLETMQIVETCPRNKNEMEEAAKEKNCPYHAKNQSCAVPEKFKYHCVINVFRNQSIEVCAPERKINGYCAEFNVDGARIQDQYQTDCTVLDPPCPTRYSSTEAYLYQACYKHPSVLTNTTTNEISSAGSRSTSPSNFLPNSETDNKISALWITLTVIGIILLVAIPLLLTFLWQEMKPLVVHDLEGKYLNNELNQI
ncbi:uncharacterized protein LOC133204308 [Saccostrea echinata]|uniref:uncharacterized protein LOC133204308 n=1 Tax=Saccostrea echinata TaxID=191078 RepID=UPI002A815432|nr:uncharacterized protein LOC133204308 [Saccostrea echinata]